MEGKDDTIGLRGRDGVWLGAFYSYIAAAVSVYRRSVARPPPLLFLASGTNSSMLDLKGKAKREGEDVLVSKMKQV